MKVKNLRKGAITLALFIIMALVSSCTGTNLRNLAGFSGNHLNTNPVPSYGEVSYVNGFKGGFLFHHDSTNGPVPGLAKGVKRGESCAHSILLGAFAWGDSSIDTARKVGKIEKIGYVEYEHMAVFAGSLWHGFCTTVAGE